MKPQNLATFAYWLGLADAMDNPRNIDSETLTLTLTNEHREILSELAQIVHGYRLPIEHVADPGTEQGVRGIIAKYHDDAMEAFTP